MACLLAFGVQRAKLRTSQQHSLRQCMGWCVKMHGLWEAVLDWRNSLKKILKPNIFKVEHIYFPTIQIWKESDVTITYITID